MKTESLSTYTPPTGPQAKEFCSALTGAVPLPHKELTQLWLSKPNLLAIRLRTLYYRPAFIHRSNWAGDVSEVMGTCMVTWIANATVMIIDDDDGPADLFFLNGYSPAHKRIAQAKAAEGVTVIIRVIPEDLEKFKGLENIFPCSCPPFDHMEMTRFVEQVLAQLQDKLYCGPK